MKILAVEFSSVQRSVAVLNAGQGQPTCLSELIQAGERSTVALGMIEQALQEAGIEREQIEVLATGVGPGSYTGIRAAISLAQGWHLASGVKLLAISSADCLATVAQQAGITGTVAVVIDAQRGEFYLAKYKLGPDSCQTATPLQLVTAAQVQSSLAAGDHIVGGPEANRFPGHRLMFPRAATLGQLALQRDDFIAPHLIEPIYLREVNFVKAPPARILPQ